MARHWWELSRSRAGAHPGVDAGQRRGPGEPQLLRCPRRWLGITLSLLLLPAPLCQADERPDLRLSLVRVWLLIETGRHDEAFVMLQKLKNDYPDHPRVLGAEADLYLRLDNRSRGLALLELALMVDPDDEALIERRLMLLREQAPRVHVAGIRRSSEQSTRAWTRLQLWGQLGPAWIASLVIEEEDVRSRGSFTNADGLARPFTGDRQRGELWLTRPYDDGDEAALSLFGTNGVLGLGARYLWWDRMGTTSVEIDFQRPERDYLETVVQEGTRDRVWLSRRQRFGAGWQARLGGGGQRYGIDGDGDVARSLGLAVEIAYTHPISRGAIGAYYTLDAEYFSGVEERMGPEGRFEPFPATSYEVHSAGLSASWELSRRLDCDAFAGYAVDRLGGDGPVFGAALEYALSEQLSLELGASRGQVAEREGDKLDELRLLLHWRPTLSPSTETLP